MQHFFPPLSPFLELIQQAEHSPDSIVVRDHSSGMTATAGQLLYSVSLLRAELQAKLEQNSMYDTQNDNEDRFIFLLAPPGLEYVVAMLTIFALGAGMSAQCAPSLSVLWSYHADSIYSNRYQTRRDETLIQARKAAGPPLRGLLGRESGGNQSFMCPGR